MPNNKNTEVLAGYVGVDSGMILLIDPAHADGQEFSPATFDPLLEDPAMPVRLNGIELAVAFNTGSGDGFFPVYLELDERDDVVGVRIDLTRP